MSAFALIAKRLYTGETICLGQAVLVEGAAIRAVMPEGELPAGVPRRLLGDALLAPGFIDSQVNGGGGALLNDAPTAETIRIIGAAHRRFGTTGFLPTLITDSREKMAAAVSAVRQARREGVPGVLGIHLEGPYLNKERKGVHDPAKLSRPTEADLALLTSLAEGVTLVTLAPEMVPAGMIARLAAAGVIVSAGHTAATYEQTRVALAEGLRGFTHLFNAMTPLGSREPGVVGAALADEASWCGIIVDGFHVHPTTLKLALAAKPAGRTMLVTDAMPPVGADSGQFMLNGEVIVTADGRCVTADGTIAGSCLDMAGAVRNTVRLLGVPLPEALRMASLNPAEFLGLAGHLGRVAPGYRADLVLLDGELQVLDSWIGGIAANGP